MTKANSLRQAAAGMVMIAPMAAWAATGASTESPDMIATTLIVIGIALLLLEIKIISQGVLALLAAACLITASVLIWRDGASFWGIPVEWVIPVIALILLIGVALSMLAVKAHNAKLATGIESFVNQLAEASEALNPNGQVFFQGAYWQAQSTAPVAKGAKVRILSANNLTLAVEPYNQEQRESHSPSPSQSITRQSNQRA